MKPELCVLLLMTFVVVAFIVNLIIEYYRSLVKDKIIATLKITNYKIKQLGENAMIEMQTDQKFWIDLQYPDDGGVPVPVGTRTASSTNPDAFTITEIPIEPIPEVPTYRFEVKGSNGVVTGAGSVLVEADPGNGVLLSYELAVSTIPNQAESVVANISPLMEQ